MFYQATYLRNDYRLSDALRPNPRYGNRIFNIDANSLPEHTDEDVISAAKDTAPDGYWLQKLEAYGGDPHRREIINLSVLNCRQTPSIVDSDD